MLVRLKDDLEKGNLNVGELKKPSPESLKDLGISRFLKTKEVKAGSGYQEAMITAMKREEEAWRGYMTLADMTSCPEMKDLFTLLAQVEAGHLRRIEALYESEILEGY
jgi:rubrerythrin